MVRDLGGKVWGGGSSGGRELCAEDMGSGVGVRERFKCCGAQSDQLGLDRSDRSLRLVRLVLPSENLGFLGAAKIAHQLQIPSRI